MQQRDFAETSSHIGKAQPEPLTTFEAVTLNG